MQAHATRSLQHAKNKKKGTRNKVEDVVVPDSRQNVLATQLVNIHVQKRVTKERGSSKIYVHAASLFFTCSQKPKLDVASDLVSSQTQPKQNKKDCALTAQSYGIYSVHSRLIKSPSEERDDIHKTAETRESEKRASRPPRPPLQPRRRGSLPTRVKWLRLHLRRRCHTTSSYRRTLRNSSRLRVCPCWRWRASDLYCTYIHM